MDGFKKNAGTCRLVKIYNRKKDEGTMTLNSIETKISCTTAKNIPTEFTYEKFNTLVPEWIASMSISKKSKYCYRLAIKSLFRWLQTHKVVSPKQEDIQNYKEWLQQNCKTPTVCLYLSAVRSFFNWTAQTHVYADIAKDVKSPHLALADRLNKKDALSAEQARILLESVDRSTLAGMRDYAILALMLTTGLRIISIVSANVAGLEKNGDDMVLHCTGKSLSPVDVKLATPVWTAIHAYLEARTPIRRDAAGTPLFSSLSRNYFGGRLSTRMISKIVKDRLKNVGIVSCRLTAHSLRHTAATLGLQSGGTMEDVRRLLGHADFTSTSLYCHGQPGFPEGLETHVANAVFGSQSKEPVASQESVELKTTLDEAQTETIEIEQINRLNNSITDDNTPDIVINLPEKKKQQKMELVTMRLTPEIKATLRKMAHIRGMSLGAFCTYVMDSVAAYSDKDETSAA